ncbi:MAG TPA: OmpA family protein [Bacteroidia bacterium]|nr:OmpA family protein [Bacteroidia bacterium]
MRNRILLLFLLSSTLLITCIPLRKYDKEVAARKNAEAVRDSLLRMNDDYSTKSTEMNRQLEDNKRQITHLLEDTAGCGRRYRTVNSQYNQLIANYELLLKQNKDLMARTTSENTQLVGRLNMTQEQMIAKEDSLKRLDLSLRRQRKTLDSLTFELHKREARVQELSAALAKKDSAVAAILKKVDAALFSFKGQGLTVEKRNGKVYVSMEDKLLFASGSYKVSPKGEEALKSLSGVLVTNADINVMVEGHTDDVPYKGTGDIKDNWDLSVLRATTVVKILLKYGNNKIDQKRLTAAGRGEFFPIDPARTEIARAKNRRTEIILTPKLDELFNVLNPN